MLIKRWRPKKWVAFLVMLVSATCLVGVVSVRKVPVIVQPAIPALCSETLAAEGPISICPAYQPGEKLIYRVSWEKILLAGTAELSVAGGGTNLQFHLKASTSPSIAALCNLQDDFLSTYDGILGAPVRYEKNFSLKQKTVKEIVTFNQLGKSAQWMSAGRQSQELSIEVGTQDPISALYSVRNLGLKPGLRLILPLVDGSKKYLLDITVVNAELVSISTGTYNTLRAEVNWRLAGQPVSSRRITLWLTNDSRKIPVLAAVTLPIGTGLVELISIS